MIDPRECTTKPNHLPSPEEIRQATAEIREGWSEIEKQRRKCDDVQRFVKLTNRGRKRWNGHIIPGNHQVIDDIIEMEQGQVAASLWENPEN